MHVRWLVGAVVVGAAALTVLAIVARGPYDAEGPDATVGGPPLPTTGSVIDALGSLGGREDLSALIGQRVEVVVNIGPRVNDIAFWTGTPPDDLLVVIGRDTRSGSDRQRGEPSDDALSVPVLGMALLRGVIEPLPYAEAMFSWRLTRRDIAVVQERGVYLRVDEVIPLTQPAISAREIDEASRETAPPPGEQVETPLDLPPPLP